MDKKIEEVLNDVTKELTRVGDEVKKTAEQALQQSRNAGTLSEEVKAKADELLTTQTALAAKQDEVQAKIEALDSRATEVEQAIASRKPGGREAPMSLGRAVTVDDDYKNFVERGCSGSLRIKVNNAITSVSPGGGGLIWSDREEQIVEMPRRRMTIRALLMPGRTGSNLVEYAKQTVRTNTAAPVAEGAQKPESDYKWDKADAPVRTIAHFIHASRQAVDDAAQLQSEIDGELRYGLDLEEENQMLNGDGTGENLSGLVTEATAYAAAFTPAAETMIDIARLAFLQASLAEYVADGMVMNPTDWARIELTKDSQNGYIFANPTAATGPVLWGKPIIETQAMTIDKFLADSFRMAAQIYDRQDAEVLISSEDRDNFIKNMLTIRAEKRLAMAVKRAAGLVYGDFGNVA